MTRVRIVNPLPELLGPYTRALVAALREAGATALEDRDVQSIDMGGAGLIRRLDAARGLARVARRSPWTEVDHTVVTWPALNLLEPALWSRRRADGSVAHVIVHDPAPLRPQFGMSSAAAKIGRTALRCSTTKIVVHTDLAARELRDAGWPVDAVIPLALNSPTEGARVHNNTVVVCGMFKPARDLDGLRRLGPGLRALGLRPRIVGQGWPDIDGWEVDARRVSDAELDRTLHEAGCVIVPYTRYFQSGIAARALELGTPIVGERHEFLERLLGRDWPGFTRLDAIDAAEVVRATMEVDPTKNVECYRIAVTSKWRAYLGTGR